MKKWVILFGLTLFLFRGAFSTHIFQDDFFLFVSSRFPDFSPFKSYGFYRPVGIELFYYLAGLINNLLITRLIVFSVFFTGLVFLNKSIGILIKNNLLAFLTTFISALSFTHVFQLYWLATFQEVAMFCFSAITTYFYLKKQILASLIFFLFALLSREQAMLLPVLFFILTRNFRRTLIYFVIVVPFLLLYVFNYAQVAIRPEYAPSLNLKLIVNNVLWYGLWSFGLPNFFPDFITSIFSFSPKTLWEVIVRNNAVFYIISWLFFIVLFTFSAFLARGKKLLAILGVCLFGFLIFVLPISVIVHKWMVRLTIPSIFISFFIAYVIFNSKKYLGFLILILYIIYNILAISVHENTSTYKYESEISLRAGKIVANNNCVYFLDETDAKSGWEGSQKLKLTLFDQWFSKYYWPNKNIKVYYGFETKNYPADCLIIPAADILDSASARKE